MQRISPQGKSPSPTVALQATSYEDAIEVQSVGKATSANGIIRDLGLVIARDGRVYAIPGSEKQVAGTYRFTIGGETHDVTIGAPKNGQVYEVVTGETEKTSLRIPSRIVVGGSTQAQIPVEILGPSQLMTITAPNDLQGSGNRSVRIYRSKGLMAFQMGIGKNQKTSVDPSMIPVSIMGLQMDRFGNLTVPEVPNGAPPRVFAGRYMISGPNGVFPVDIVDGRDG